MPTSISLRYARCWAADGSRRMRGRARLVPPRRTSKEKTAQAKRKDQAAVQRVLETGQRHRAGLAIADSEQSAADQRHRGCDPVQKHHVYIAERKRRHSDVGACLAENRAVAVEQKTALDQFLRPYRQDP